MRKRDIVLIFIGGSIGISLASKLTKHLPWFKKMDAQNKEIEKNIGGQINDLVRDCFPMPNFDVHLEDVHLDKVQITEEDLRESIENARKAGVPEDQILHNIEEVDEFFLG